MKSASGGGRRTALPILATLLAPALAVAVLGATGALAPLNEPGIPDPELVTRWGLPLITAVRDVSAALTVGALAVACWCLPARTRHTTGSATPTDAAWARLTSVIMWSAGTWVWSGLATLLLTYAQLSGLHLSDDLMWVSLGKFVTEFELGRYLAASTLIAAVVATGAMTVRTTAGTGLLLALALAALWPLALTGHAAGSLNHALAVESQALHLAGVTIWMGGLVAVLLIVGQLTGEQYTRVVRRYSVMAGGAFAMVLLSGITGAAIRLGSWSDLASTYGLLLGAKVSALAALGVAGWLQRRRLLDRASQTQRRRFARLAAGEIAIMAAAIGIGVALGKSAPPSAGSENPLVRAEAILGYRIPPPMGWPEWVTAWRVDGLWSLIAVVALAWYWTRVRRLRSRGDRWPLGRSLAWTTGWLMLIWATSGSPGVYGQVLFSMHMVQHMTIAMAVPALMVLGAPVTLLLRTSPARTDGSYGPREWVLRILHSPYAQIVSHPLVAAAIFIISLVSFYYSGAFELSMRSHTAHLVMVAHFLIAGYLFANSVIGIDPGQRRFPYPMRMMLVMAVFAIHAFFSVSLMSSRRVLAEDWFQLVQPPWAGPLKDDQYLGASIGWGLGDYPLAIITIALIWQWVRADHAEQRRLDRQADRVGESAEQPYSAYAQRLSSPHFRQRTYEPDE